jgi:hypothetical protein
MNSVVHAATTSPEDSTNPMHPNQNKDLELDVITYVYSKASLPNVTSPKWIYLDFGIVLLSGRKLTSSSSPFHHTNPLPQSLSSSYIHFLREREWSNLLQLHRGWWILSKRKWGMSWMARA